MYDVRISEIRKDFTVRGDAYIVNRTPYIV
jgi:hypothetical protein